MLSDPILCRALDENRNEVPNRCTIEFGCHVANDGLDVGPLNLGKAADQSVDDVVDQLNFIDGFHGLILIQSCPVRQLPVYAQVASRSRPDGGHSALARLESGDKTGIPPPFRGDYAATKRPHFEGILGAGTQESLVGAFRRA